MKIRCIKYNLYQGDKNMNEQELRQSINDRNSVNANLKEKIKDKLPKLKEVLLNSSVSTYFCPSIKLKQMVSQNTHPIIMKLPNEMKALILDNKPFYIQNRLVWSWLTGNLDENNSFILENGDIRIISSDSSGNNSYSSYINNNEGDK